MNRLHEGLADGVLGISQQTWIRITTRSRRFGERFLKQLKPLFVQILLLARTMGSLNLGKISLHGSKVKAIASKHRRIELRSPRRNCQSNWSRKWRV